MKVTRQQVKIHAGTPLTAAEEEVEDIAVVLLAIVLLLLYSKLQAKKDKLGKYRVNTDIDKQNLELGLSDM